jgi:hypothetical protein
MILRSVFWDCIDAKDGRSTVFKTMVTVYQSTTLHVPEDFANTGVTDSCLASSSSVAIMSNNLNGVACICYRNHMNCVNIRLKDMNQHYSGSTAHAYLAVSWCTDFIIHLLSARNCQMCLDQILRLHSRDALTREKIGL